MTETPMAGTDASHLLLDALERALVVSDEGGELESDPTFRAIIDPLGDLTNLTGGMSLLGTSVQIASAIVLALKLDIFMVGLTSSSKRDPDRAVADAISRLRESLEEHRRVD